MHSVDKDIHNVTKDFISHKYCSFELAIYQSMLEKKVSGFSQKY